MENELQILANQRNKTLEERVAALEAAAIAQAPDSNAAIANLIDDSDFSWSTAAFTTAAVTPATAGDSNNRAYNWYRMQRATALLVENDAASLKGPAHSLYAGETADTPRWSKTDGWGRIGETGATAWDIACPLPNNFVTPGMRFYIQMLARLGTATALPGEIKFFWEFCDNTNSAPLPDIIKGSAFALAAATFGPLGATTRAYKLIVATDAGDMVESTVATVTDAPATLTPTNGVALSWPRYPGFTNVEIYVTVGGNSFLVGIVGDGAGAFNDVGQTLGPVAAVPSVSGTVPRAYAETRPGLFELSSEWVLFEFAIAIPFTYNFSLTTGKQWLRGGVLGLTGDPLQVEIDRIGVSTGTGKWSISEGDRKALSLPSTTQTSSTQGPPSGGGGPPDDGEGGPGCSTLDTPIDICDANGENERKIELRHVTKGDYVIGHSERPNKVTRVKLSWSESIITIETANGARRRCSPSDFWLVKDGPKTGTDARRLCEGMEVETRINGSVQTSKIVQYSVSTKGEEVATISTDGDHVYYAGNAAAHNLLKA